MDITLRPIHFEMEGLVGFLGNGVCIDRQDLTSRMEGYSVQGICGKIVKFYRHSETHITKVPLTTIEIM